MTTQMMNNISPKLFEVMERAKRDPEVQFLSLAHLLDEAILTRVFHRLRRGTVQGSAPSALLGNVYLRHVLHIWFERDGNGGSTPELLLKLVIGSPRPVEDGVISIEGGEPRDRRQTLMASPRATLFVIRISARHSCGGYRVGCLDL